eukprot:c3702_g1_i1.p1 GENE.c3702_g1_i1~~c3702_g1_i1.p1  ORF type:complete len:273 (-),score=38.95 c3702_g1_i1:52-870(-)
MNEQVPRKRARHAENTSTQNLPTIPPSAARTTHFSDSFRKHSEFLRFACESALQMREVSVDTVASELLRALICKNLVVGVVDVSLPVRLDMCWHHLILETEDYAEFCQEVFGRFLHHTTRTAKDAVHLKNGRVERLRVVYHNFYGSQPDKWCWENEDEITANLTRQTNTHQLEPPPPPQPTTENAPTGPTPIPVRRLTVVMRYGRGNFDEDHFIASETTLAGRVMAIFAARRALSQDALLFLSNGKRVEPTDMLRDLDQPVEIDVLLRQIGC